MNKNEATTQETFEEKVKQHAIDNLPGREGTLGCDLHNALFNEDYFVIGHYTARQYLNIYGVFEAIDSG